MIACLPVDKLTRTKQTLLERLTKKSCTLHELQSLIHKYATICMPRRGAWPRFSTTHDQPYERRHRTTPSYKAEFVFPQGRYYVASIEQENGTNVFLDIAPTNSPELEFSTDASDSLCYAAFFQQFLVSRQVVKPFP